MRLASLARACAERMRPMPAHLVGPGEHRLRHRREVRAGMSLPMPAWMAATALSARVESSAEAAAPPASAGRRGLAARRARAEIVAEVMAAALALSAEPGRAAPWRAAERSRPAVPSGVAVRLQQAAPRGTAARSGRAAGLLAAARRALVARRALAA